MSRGSVHTGSRSRATTAEVSVERLDTSFRSREENGSPRERAEMPGKAVERLKGKVENLTLEDGGQGALSSLEWIGALLGHMSRGRRQT